MVIQLVTGDNWSGITFGYMGCKGYTATLYCSVVYALPCRPTRTNAWSMFDIPMVLPVQYL